jgi:hypothetical protein
MLREFSSLWLVHTSANWKMTKAAPAFVSKKNPHRPPPPLRRYSAPADRSRTTHFLLFRAVPTPILRLESRCAPLTFPSRLPTAAAPSPP